MLEWNKNLNLIYTIYYEIESKSGIEFELLRDLIFRGLKLGMESKVISIQSLYFASQILNRINDKSLMPIFLDVLRQFVAQDNWEAIRSFTIWIKTARYYEGEIKRIIEDRISMAKKIVEGIATTYSDYLCIFCCWGIGDTIFAASFSKYLQTRVGKSKTCLIVREGQESLGNMFDNVQKVVSIPQKSSAAIKCFVLTEGIYENSNWIYGHMKVDSSTNNLIIDNELHLRDNYKMRFDIPMKSEPSEFHMKPIKTFPKIPNPDHAIILFPKANSFSSPIYTMEFWTRLAQNLKQLGFEIYTNLAPNENPIEGTIPLQLDLQQLFFASEQVKFCIGLRSGVLDLLSNANSKIIAIGNSRINALENIFPRQGIKTLFLEKDANQIESDILNFVRSGDF